MPSRAPVELRLLLGSLLLALLLGEVVLRLFWPHSYAQTPEPLQGDAWRELVHRPSSVPGLAHELAPEVSKHTLGMVVTTNSHGMRDEEPAAEKGISLIRIAAVGDSVTFATGVSGDRAWPNALEKLLNGSDPLGGFRYEVLNFGVGGYSTRQEALVVRHKVSAWDPDLLVLCYVLNDPETDPIQPLQSYYHEPAWWQHSALLRRLAFAWREWEVRRLGGGDYLQYLYAHPGKWQSVRDGFADIRRVAMELAIEVVVVIPGWIPDRSWDEYPYHDLHRKVRELAEANGFDVVDMFATFRQHDPRELRVSINDAHPNVLRAVADRAGRPRPAPRGSGPLLPGPSAPARLTRQGGGTLRRRVS